MGVLKAIPISADIGKTMYVVSGLEMKNTYPFETNFSSEMFEYYVSKDHPYNIRLY